MRSTRRRVIFGVVAAAIAICAASVALLAVDVYLHGRYERSAGFNVWGYRGPSVGRKKANEFRVVILGGSAAYGYGVSADEAIPAVLERLLNKRTTSPSFTVINLAYNNEGAYSFKATLQDYRWLDYDLAVLYEGYNDLADDDRVNVAVFRHESPVFRLTGYMPIFPIIFREKAASMKSRTVFAAALQTTADVATSLEAQLGRVSAEPVHRIDERPQGGCRAPWGPYCQSVAAAIEYARGGGKQVLVGTQPYLMVSPAVHAKHVDQQTELRLLLSRFAKDPEVRYVDLGDRLDLRDSRVSFDQMHLTASGNEQIAQALVNPVLDMASRARQRAS